MKKVRILVFLLALMLSVSTITVAASGSEAVMSKDVPATISFYDPGSTGGEGNGGGPGGGGGGGSSGGGSGGGTTRRDPPTGSLGTGNDLVTILDPDIPLGDLGDLPQTGGMLLIPLLLVTGGAWMAYLALRVPGKSAGLAPC